MEMWLLGLFAVTLVGLGGFILKELWASRILLTKIESRVGVIENKIIEFKEESEKNREMSEKNEMGILSLMTGTGK